MLIAQAAVAEVQLGFDFLGAGLPAALVKLIHHFLNLAYGYFI